MPQEEVLAQQRVYTVCHVGGVPYTVVREHGTLSLFRAQGLHLTERPAVFLDRDGVLNRRVKGGYVTKWADFEVFPDVLAGLHDLHATNFQLIVVSNQAGVAKGLLKWQDLLSITCKSFEFFQEAGGIDAAFYCLHQPSDACGCRKPKPGLLEQAARYLKIDFRRSFLVGDSASDMLAGAAMGVKTIYLASSPDPNAKASFVTCTLKQAVCWIRGQSQS